jgi:hypothetical protein
MVVIIESVHPESLNFANQRKVVMLRQLQKMSFNRIAEKVRNLNGAAPSKELVRRVHADFSPKAGRRKFRYGNCGRSAWKVTPELRAFVLKRLLALRMKCICTSSTLQQEVAKTLCVKVATSTIRNIVEAGGYNWSPRAQKPRLGADRMLVRKLWCEKVLKMSRAELENKFTLSMDGAVFSTPPKNAADRLNFCTVGDMHMYRKPSESSSPNLAGGTKYGKQVPLARAVPLWGGISRGGFKAIAFHPTKKLQDHEWMEAVEGGKLVAAIRVGKPVLKRGPWGVLCDNEGFMHDAAAKQATRLQKVNLWHVPPRSPDLNPIEKYWSWLRRELRKRDVADLQAAKLNCFPARWLF